MVMKDLATGKAGLPRAGKIRLGYKVPNKTGEGVHPTEADHFVLKDVPEVMNWARETLGTDKPRVLPIFFPFDEPEDCLEGFYKLYFASGLWCRGDGDKILYSVDTQSGKCNIRNGRVQIPIKMNGDDDSDFNRGQEVPCPGKSEENRWSRCKECKPHMTLKFLIRDLPVEDLRMATYVLESNSVNNYVYLTQALEMFRDKGLQGIPFLLKRVQREISTPNLNIDGSQKRSPGGALYAPKILRKKWLVELEVDPTWVQQMMEREAILADPMRGVTHQLGAGDSMVIESSANDDAEQSADFESFLHSVLMDISFFTSYDQIEKALDDMGFVYEPKNEEFLFESLDSYAQTMADAKAGPTAPAQAAPPEQERWSPEVVT